jgi:hypothetical protein
MEQTEPRHYPFPQCDPPLTKDASDIVQVANLALSIDADITNLNAIVDNNLLSPDGCHLAAVAQTIQQGDPIQFATVRFDNTPGLAMSETGGIRTIADGVYLMTCWVQVDQGPTPPLDSLKLISIVEGVGELASEGLSTNFNTTTIPGEVVGSLILRLNAGQLVQVSVRTVGVVTLDVEQSEFAMVRMGPK